MPIIYTKTDEAPALATASLLPIIEAFTKKAGVDIEVSDISLAARILAALKEWLPAEDQVVDALGKLSELTHSPDANIIKLPNISASIPQLKAAIAELQDKGFSVPDYPDEPVSDEQERIKKAYDSVKGSAVNPVLRQGNSDRRAPLAIKNYVRKHPHEMKPFASDSLTNVATMQDEDFAHNEKTFVSNRDQILTVQLKQSDGTVVSLRDDLRLAKGEIFDATVLNSAKLDEFLKECVVRAKSQDLLYSIHLKATMMKVSDPIIFGHAVRTFFEPVFEEYAKQLADAGARPIDGLAQVLASLENLESSEREEIKRAFAESLESGPRLAMVDSDRGITNLHVPSDVIIDASLPAMIKAGGKMWNSDGNLQDTLAVIPDSSYAGVYQTVLDDCRKFGAYQPEKLGTVQNVGLMAMAAEEYGSHDKTFEIPADGVVQVVNDSGELLLEHVVKAGDIWRGCQTKRVAVEDWVKLAVNRARTTGMPAIFWLAQNRAHDAKLIELVNEFLPNYDTVGLEIKILDPVSATRYTLQRLRNGENTIAVTGNVLRDYLTDLFPIIEVGTSAKMLSIVPLLHGGGMFETGAGGSAPKHVQQFVSEGHLRWDSLGEFMALGASLEQYGESNGNEKANILAETLDKAIQSLLEDDCSPSRTVGEIDNPESHFHLAERWARELSAQDENAELSGVFSPLAEKLSSDSERIVSEFRQAQGSAEDLGGYYLPAHDKLSSAMRPSKTLNRIIESF